MRGIVMEDKNNLFNDDIEIIDDFDNDNLDNIKLQDEIGLANNQSLPEHNVIGPDFMADFISGFNNENDLSSESLNKTDNQPISNTTDIFNSNEIETTKDEEDRVTEVLNRAEIIDAKIAVPIEEKKESLAITQEKEKEVDNKKGMAFIIILFIILIIFIFALPEITKIIQQIVG